MLDDERSRGGHEGGDVYRGSEIEITEAQYIEQGIDRLYQVRLVRGATVGAFLFIVLISLDSMALPDHRSDLMALRLLAAGLLFVAAQSSRLVLRPLYHRVLGLAIIALSAGLIEFMILRSGEHASASYGGMVLLAVVAIGFLPGRAWFTISAALLIYSVYVVPLLPNERIVSTREFVTANFFLATISASMVLLRHLYDRNLISELGQHYELQQHQYRLQELVRARTEELEAAVADLRQEIAERDRSEGRLQRAAEGLRRLNEELN